MPVTITINGENAAQAIEEFATLSASFIPGSAQAPVTATTEEPKPRQRKNPPAKKEEPEEKPADVDSMLKENGEGDAESAEVPSVVDLRAKAQEVGKTAEGKKAVKALLNKFESPNISELPEDKRAAFMAELEKLA